MKNHQMFIFGIIVSDKTDCDATGGKYLRGPLGFECIVVGK